MSRTADRIEINPRVMMGKPVIRDTRIPVELLLRKISEGATEDDLLDAYPRLQREDIRAAITAACPSPSSCARIGPLSQSGNYGL